MLYQKAFASLGGVRIYHLVREMCSEAKLFPPYPIAILSVTERTRDASKLIWALV